MERRGRREGLLDKTAQALDLPADVLAGLPRVELIGDREVRMENHRGILSYGDEQIHISAGGFVIKIVGEELKLRAMTGLELLVTGRIRGVELA